jgi:mannose-1-phosphate guanylyltransferase
MRAILLAAGLGTRLRPLTDTVPKCLLPIDGRPQLWYWLDLLRKHGVDRVLVNTHHLADDVAHYVRTEPLPVEVTLAHEPVLLGSAGTVRANRAFVAGEETFVIGYADTLIQADLSAMYRFHKALNVLATIGLFHAPVPSACGIAEVDARGIVTSFVEKPRAPKSDLAFAGIMMCSPAMIDLIPDRFPCDLGSEVLNRLVGSMGGWDMGGAYVRDIGTQESYALAQEEIAAMKVNASCS